MSGASFLEREREEGMEIKPEMLLPSLTEGIPALWEQVFQELEDCWQLLIREHIQKFQFKADAILNESGEWEFQIKESQNLALTLDISESESGAVKLYFRLHPAILEHLSLARRDFKIALALVVKKKWHPKFVSPLILNKRTSRKSLKPSQRYIDLLEPRGELFLSIWELCEASYDASRPECQGYSSPAHWYGQILKEAINQEIQEIIANQSLGKKQFVAECRQKLKLLKDSLRFENFKYSSHFQNLLELNYRYGDPQQDLWNSLLKAYSRYIQSLEDPDYQEAYVDARGLVRRNGKGKQTIVMFKKN